MGSLLIAIDPGANGAICSLKNGQVTVVNMPKQITDLRQYFKGLIDGAESSYCFIERVQSWVGDEKQAGKRFGIEKMLRQYTEIKTVMQMLDIPFHETNSRSWQKIFLNGQKFEAKDKTNKSKAKAKAERKNKLKEICQAKYPQIKVTLKNCDALLILLYGNQEMQINRRKYIAEKPQKLF